MGKEIQSTLSEENTAEFFRRLTEETGRVLAWGKNKRFAPFVPRVGLEIEACLVDEGFHAVPINEKFLKSLNNPHATIELARFNVEFNPPPLALSKNILAELREQLGDLYARANDTAEKTGCPSAPRRHPPDPHARRLGRQHHVQKQPLPSLRQNLWPLAKGPPDPRRHPPKTKASSSASTASSWNR